MVFNIGTQNAGVANNVGRDQHIAGGQQGSLVVTPLVLQALQSLRSVVTSASVDDLTTAEANRQLDSVEAELRSQRPDPARVAGPLEKVTRLLVAAGPLAAAVGPLHMLAGWLGSFGDSLLRLLPGLG